MKLSHFRFPLTLTAPLAIAPLAIAPLAMATLFNACVSSEETTTSDDSSSDTASMTTSSTTDSTTGAGGNTSSTMTTGTSTTGGPLDCAMAQAITGDAVIDFETYDGTTEADGWEFNFNGDAEGAGAVYAGLWPLTDDTGAYSLSFETGADGSNWSISAQNPSGTDWGGGIGMWTGCMDASSFTGIQFMLNLDSPVNSGTMTIGTPTVEVRQDYSVTTAGEWELVQLPFANFRGDGQETTDGSGIGNFVFSAHVSYVDDGTGIYVPEPGAFDIAIDNISFY